MDKGGSAVWKVDHDEASYDILFGQIIFFLVLSTDRHVYIQKFFFLYQNYNEEHVKAWRAECSRKTDCSVRATIFSYAVCCAFCSVCLPGVFFLAFFHSQIKPVGLSPPETLHVWSWLQKEDEYFLLPFKPTFACPGLTNYSVKDWDCWVYCCAGWKHFLQDWSRLTCH